MFRKANLDDIEKFIKLYIDGFRIHQENRNDIFANKSDDELLNDLKENIDKDSNFYIYEDNSNILGYVSFHIKEKTTKSLWIDELVVDSNFRGQGIGTKILNEIRKIAKENNCDRIEFCCWSFNETAMKFYEKLGYKKQRVIFEEKI